MSLTAPYENDNIFAKIIAGDIPCTKIFEDESCLAFMDLYPQTRGHCLVISKTAQATNLLAIDPGDLESLIIRVQTVARAVHKALSPDGIKIAQFNGAPAGQTVFHLHFHVIPVYEGAKTKPHANPANKEADMEAVATEIRRAF
ncbi:MAG: HIT domain-containing protein [Pseudomonadota bacterium]